jgi:hypothetical protein
VELRKPRQCWDVTRNGCTFKDRPSNKGQYWWLCPQGHSTKRSYDRWLKKGCFECAQLASTKKKLSHLRIAKEWHPTRNRGLDPARLSPYSGKKAWWLCSLCGSEWQAKIECRSPLDRFGCPKCRKRETLVQSVAEHPELAHEWHPTKNTSSPDLISIHSPALAWWLCSKCGFEWLTSPKSRTNKKDGRASACLRCHRESRRGRCRGHPLRPDLKLDWHPDNSIPADKVGGHSTVPAKWRCSGCGHEWVATPGSRGLSSKSAYSCPECVKRLAASGDLVAKQMLGPGCPSLAEAKPWLVPEWHPTKNGELQLSEVSSETSRKVWWLCPNGHEWQSRGSFRGRQRHRAGWCPICPVEAAKKKRRDREAAWELLESEWHEENGPVPKDLDPRELGRRYRWRCRHGHPWGASPKHRLKHPEHKCPTCQLVGPAITKVTEHPLLSIEWDAGANGQLEGVASKAIPHQWVCSSCGTQWKASIKLRLSDTRNRLRLLGGCPTCNNLTTKFPELAAEWHPTKNESPPPVYWDTKPAWWRCSQGHEWVESTSDRAKNRKLCRACTRANRFRVHTERNLWAGMINRCLPDGHPDYGRRGIRVCERWANSYESFIEDMGPRPSARHSIDREDVNGNYEPSNCRWGTPEEQNRNHRNTQRLTYQGESLTVAEWSERLKIPRGTIKQRLLINLPMSEVFDPARRNPGTYKKTGRASIPRGMGHMPEAQAWEAMIARCTNPRCPAWADYGGRGITVCPEWLNSFEAFLRDMGPRPSPLYSLDRKENNEGYSPGNCRWATKKEQSRNTRGNRLLRYGKVTLAMAEWAERRGMKPEVVRSRLRIGWTVAEALGFRQRKQPKALDPGYLHQKA